MKILYCATLMLFFHLKTLGQETLYWINGSNFPYKLTAATESVVKIAEVKGDRILTRSVPRENVIVAFNSKGNFLMVSRLSPDPKESDQQIQGFYDQPGSAYDLLIWAKPVQVVECNISYKSEYVVNYTTRTGLAGSVNRKDLALIIYKNGIHDFITPPAEAAEILDRATSLIEKAKDPGAFSTPADSASQVAAIDTSKRLSKMTLIETKSAEGIKSISDTNTTAKDSLNKNAIIESEKRSVKESDQPGLSAEDIAAYSAKGIKKVDEFVQYLNTITDRNISPDKKDEAIEQAIDLFLSDATIEVTSSNRQGKRRYPIKDYLTRLKLLPYSATKISWNEINYIKDLKQESDGNYYGLISGTQTFMGFDTNSQDVVYSDITTKNVKVKLRSYKKSSEGRQTTNWEILLGNIGISANP
ncbi:MAG: hypothetical protein ABIN80_13570 [Dyadobacter sp.]|uniref:hypothetical protein n=1 Tax=Dyadobacter sp. TaxID=1914288 RepID=UPI003262F467